MRRILLALFAWIFVASTAFAQIGIAFPGPGTVHSTSGGGFSDADWPVGGVGGNRPDVVGTTLSWVGPLGGGANNGNPVRQTATVVPSGSCITTSSNGQVIKNVQVPCIIVQNNNVTIEENVITQSCSTCTLIDVRGGATGLIVEDNVIDGQRGTYNGLNDTVSSFAWTATAIRRNTIKGMENGITGNEHDMPITDNYFTGLGNAGSSTYDGDMIEIYDCVNLDIEHNTFDATNSTQSVGILNSAINLSNLGPLTGITINNNSFINMGPSAPASFIICDDNSFGGGSVTWSFTNNQFYLKNAATAFRRDSVALTANSGNFTSTTQAGHTGTLINSGTGQI